MYISTNFIWEYLRGVKLHCILPVCLFDWKHRFSRGGGSCMENYTQCGHISFAHLPVPEQFLTEFLLCTGGVFCPKEGRKSKMFFLCYCPSCPIGKVKAGEYCMQKQKNSLGLPLLEKSQTRNVPVHRMDLQMAYAFLNSSNVSKHLPRGMCSSSSCSPCM